MSVVADRAWRVLNRGIIHLTNRTIIHLTDAAISLLVRIQPEPDNTDDIGAYPPEFFAGPYGDDVLDPNPDPTEGGLR